MRSPLVLLLIAPVAFAQPTRPSVNDLSPLDRQANDFYGALAVPGARLTVAWGVSPAAVNLGSDITLTLAVTGAANPHELTRPALADREEFKQLFSSVEGITAPPPDPAARRGEFRYKVRPRAEGKFQIPELKYMFARRANGQTQFQTVRAEALLYTVTKPVVKPTPAVPLDGPPHFFELRTGGPFARSGGPGIGWWAGLFGAAVVAGFGWVFVWRVLFPDAVRLAKIRRTRAVRVALDRLRKVAKASDPAAATAAAFRGYLSARFGVPLAAQTPAEVAASLRELGFPADRVSEAEVMLRRCDAVRFAGESDATVSPAAVVALIERWEGVRG